MLLHGFGSSHRAWDAVMPALARRRRAIAYDLPGHAGSLGHRPLGNAGVAARAVLADLDRRGIGRAHLAGHSMGGAVAAVAALTAPERCASLTLLAPGGFGREVNHRLLARFAAADDAGELAVLVEQFFGWDSAVPEGLALAMMAERAAPGGREALATIAASLFDAGGQKTLPVDDLAATGVPIKVVWGTQDRVIPTRQAHKLPGRIAVHIFEGVGHMLPYEIPDDVAALILDNAR